MIFENQPHQQECVRRILTALAGINFNDSVDDKVWRLRENLKTMAQESRAPNIPICDKWGIDILMETGTGKTFIYLNTIFELYKQFNQKKFIIVLPRTAIKQGVLQNIQLTDSYFFEKYGKHLNVIDYGKNSIGSVQNDFIHSDDLSVLVITNSAFNSRKNIINKKEETLYEHGSTWKGLVSRQPVIIIDEPHLLKGNQTTKYLDEMTDSLRLRFGATFPREDEHRLANAAYVLDSISSFNQYLVKQIRVNTEFVNREESSIRIQNIRTKKLFTVCYNINEQLHKTTIRLGDDVGVKTGVGKYKGVSVVKIKTTEVLLSSGERLQADVGYELNDDEIRLMIRRTIALHFEKEQRYFERNIKTLSLFFIPRVQDFRQQEGQASPRVKSIFEEEYRLQQRAVIAATDNTDYKAYLGKDIDDGGELRVHQGYFSGDKGNEDEKETAGVNLILNDKERLLSFDTPLRFVFSVWALQEGWDSPNVFNICKLSATKQETSRRQQVGRGLRLAVNQSGKRLSHKQLGEKESVFYDINTLDMIISGQEQHFIHAIQNEIMQASYAVVGDRLSNEQLVNAGLNANEAMNLLFGLQSAGIIEFDKAANDYKINSSVLPYLRAHRGDFQILQDEARYQFICGLFDNNHDNMVKDGNQKPKMVKVRRAQWREFQQLWETINKESKIVYQAINEQKIIHATVAAFAAEDIQSVHNHHTRQKLDPQTNKINNVEETTAAYDTAIDVFFTQHTIADYATEFAKTEKYPLAFIVALFNQLDMNKFKGNPAKSGRFIRQILREEIHKTVLCQVSYEFGQTSIYANELQDEQGELIEEVKHTALGRFYADDKPQDVFLYDTVVYDSNIEKNSILNNPSEVNGSQIVVFAKLPKINIPTPYKTYNPDFAYLIKTADGKQLFLVVETKGYKFESNIPVQERQKIDYARRFFTALQQELPHVDIQFKTRINHQRLSELIP